MTRARLAFGLAFGASVLASRGAFAQAQSPQTAPPAQAPTPQPAQAAAPRRAAGRAVAAPPHNGPANAPAAAAPPPAAPPVAPPPAALPAAPPAAPAPPGAQPTPPNVVAPRPPAPGQPGAPPPMVQPVYVDQYGRPIQYVDQYGRPVQPPPGYAPAQQPPPGYAPAQPPPGYAPAQQPPPGYAPAQQPPPGYAPAQQPPPGYAPAQQPPPGYAPVYVDQYGRPIQPPPNPYPNGYVPQPPVRREPANLHGTIGLHALFTVYQGSTFRDASHAWGYDAFSGAVGAALDGGYHFHRVFLLGARLALSSADGGQAAYDGSRMSMLTFDFNAIGRIGYPLHLGRGDWIFFPGFQFEVGGMYANTTLRMQSTSAVVPRIAGEALFAFMGKRAGLSLRLGYQWAMWGNAGMSGEALALGGLMIGLGLEFRL